MNKIWLYFLLVSALFLPVFVSATSGACSYHGGVDCSAGSGIYGQVICNDGWTGSSVQYSSMVECGGGYDYQPTCPISSTYDSVSGTCKCDYGYLVHDGQCVSQLNYCWDTLGYNSEWNYAYSTCSCNSGYVLNSTQTSCISGDSYCWNNYGYNSSYDSLSKTCECDSGYQLIGGQCQAIQRSYYIPPPIINTPAPVICPNNSSALGGKCYCNTGYEANGSQCISYNQSCQNQYGANTYGDGKSCYCNSGYIWNSDKTFCTQIPSPTFTPTPSSTQLPLGASVINALPSATPTPHSTPKPRPKKPTPVKIKATASPTPVISSTPSPTPTPKKKRFFFF